MGARYRVGIDFIVYHQPSSERLRRQEDTDSLELIPGLLKSLKIPPQVSMVMTAERILPFYQHFLSWHLCK
jgi:hypothetical protein